MLHDVAKTVLNMAAESLRKIIGRQSGAKLWDDTIKMGQFIVSCSLSEGRNGGLREANSKLLFILITPTQTTVMDCVSAPIIVV